MLAELPAIIHLAHTQTAHNFYSRQLILHLPFSRISRQMVAIFFQQFSSLIKPHHSVFNIVESLSVIDSVYALEDVLY